VIFELSRRKGGKREVAASEFSRPTGGGGMRVAIFSRGIEAEVLLSKRTV
jgi:hypothetical protein